MSFPGTEHYREKPKKFGVENPFVGSPQYQQDINALCDHIEDLEKQNKQAWERAALEARRVLKNGSKARKLERQVEERDKEIGKLRKETEACNALLVDAITALDSRRTESSEE